MEIIKNICCAVFKNNLGKSKQQMMVTPHTSSSGDTFKLLILLRWRKGPGQDSLGGHGSMRGHPVRMTAETLTCYPSACKNFKFYGAFED